MHAYTHTHTLHTLHTYTHKTKEIMTSRLGLWVLGKITLTQTNQAGFTSSSFLVWLLLTIGWLTPGHLSMLASGQSESRKQGSKFTMECMWNPLSLSECSVYWERRNSMNATVVVVRLSLIWVSSVPQKSTRVHTSKAVHSNTWNVRAMSF